MPPADSVIPGGGCGDSLADLSGRKDAAVIGDAPGKAGEVAKAGGVGQQVGREFRRFAKIGSSTFDWTLGLVKNVDAVIFEARKPVRIFGIGIYGPFGGF